MSKNLAETRLVTMVLDRLLGLKYALRDIAHDDTMMITPVTRQPQPFKFITATVISDLKVAVMVVAGGQATLFHDDAGLFPSDTLITQLRMLMEESK